MALHKFETSEAFIAFDLDGAEVSSGPVRWARKVLQGGAKDLARSQTYTFAVLEMARGGASAGISAEGPDRAAALEAFRAEVAPLVESGRFLPDAAKGVADTDLAELWSIDRRDRAWLGSTGERADAVSAVVTAERTVGLDGRIVAIDGLSPLGCLIADAVVARGGSVTAVASTAGTVTNPAGFDPNALRDAWSAHGADGVAQLGDVMDVDAVFDQGAEVVFAGSATGVVDHQVAERLAGCAAVVASGRLPVTARGLAVLRRSGVAVPADFVALSGSTIAAWGVPERDDDVVLTEVDATVSAICDEVNQSGDGPLLGACYRAEAFLATWQDRLPFGRPLAP